uniref:Ribosomal protein L7Ae/L30e/S12e/Gadd45 domain-containing protein n=1 Tax=Anopheles culicifacies TaxID=139723 RepID=A0A182MRB1_9DIPT
MNKAKTNQKKSSKNLRNVLAQPFNVTWPRLPDGEMKRCTKLLQRLERKHIISGCNGVIKLLQNGQIAAFFVLDTFNPQIFAKLIIQMARKRDPSVLVLALPAFPVDCCNNSVLMAIPKPKADEHSETVQEVLKWMKDISTRNGFIGPVTDTAVKVKSNRKQQSAKVRTSVDTPMTDEEVAKLYDFEPKCDPCDRNQGKKRVAHDVENFISLSDKASSSRVLSKNVCQQQNEPRPTPISDRKSFKGPYIPLTVHRVQGNPNRVEHKKKRRTQ